MNYHFFPDDKFFDSLIEDFEKLCSPGLNRYFIRSSKENGKFVHSPKAEWIPDIYDPEFRIMINAITANDKIFIHWYDIYIGKLMLTIDNSIPLYVSIMGGDFYEEPFLYHMSWLCDKKTLYSLKKELLYPTVWARRPYILAKQLLEIRKKKKIAKEVFQNKKETIRRINFLLIGKNMDAEFNNVKRMYEAPEPVHLPFIYNQNFDLAIRLEKKPKTNNTITIQIGNSAAYMNNHLDVLDKLKRFVDQNINISVPLSYGNAEYAKVVKFHYSKALGSKVEFIEDFMTREKYIKKLQETDVCIMYHNRSQALGNCIALLTLGKKLFLKKKNPLWDLFKKIGILVFDAELLASISFDDFARPLTSAQIEHNIVQLEASFSERVRLDNLTEILNYTP